MVWDVIEKGGQMKSPLWAINSFLVALLLTLTAVVLWSSRYRVHAQSLDGSKYVQQFDPSGQKTKPVNIGSIYTNDIFGTYTEPLPNDDIVIQSSPFPAPPQQVIAQHVHPKPVTYLEPLKISLVGIIAATDDTNNRAIITDDATKQESTYHVGDVVKDSQIIRIFPRKVILIRSNGQQEIMFVNEDDAVLEYQERTRAWHDIIHLKASRSYEINSKKFAHRVPSLAHFIELFDLMTVFQKGISTGCRIGHNASESAIKASGLETGDIVTSINNIPTTSTQSRLQAYNDVLATPQEQTITVKLVRDGRVLELAYKLTSFKAYNTSDGKKDVVSATKTGPVISKSQHEIDLDSEKIKIMRQRYTFAPTQEQIKKQEQSDMFKTGKASNNRRRSLAITKKTH